MRLLTAMAFVTLTALTAAADESKDAAKKLEGTYEVLDVLVGGKTDKKKNEIRSFVIKGDEITIKTGPGSEVVKFAVDPSKKPPQIDLAPPGGTLLGIYEAKDTDKGLELTIAFAKGTNGKSGERPKDLKGTGPDGVVMKLLRKKAE